METHENLENQTVATAEQITTISETEMISENGTQAEILQEMPSQLLTDMKAETTATAVTVASVTQNETTSMTAVATDSGTITYRETVVTVLIVQTFLISAILGAYVIGKLMERFK